MACVLHKNTILILFYKYSQRTKLKVQNYIKNKICVIKYRHIKIALFKDL